MLQVIVRDEDGRDVGGGMLLPTVFTKGTRGFKGMVNCLVAGEVVSANVNLFVAGSKPKAVTAAERHDMDSDTRQALESAAAAKRQDNLSANGRKR